MSFKVLNYLYELFYRSCGAICHEYQLCVRHHSYIDKTTSGAHWTVEMTKTWTHNSRNVGEDYKWGQGTLNRSWNMDCMHFTASCLKGGDKWCTNLMICDPLLFEMLHDTFERLYDKCGYIKIFQCNVKLLYKLCVQLFVCFGVTQSLLIYVSVN